MKLYLVFASMLFALACQQEATTPPASQSQSAQPAQTDTAPPAAPEASDVQVVDLKISGDQFQPATLNVQPGVPVRLNVTRDEKPTCADVLAIPSQNIKRDIPAGQVTTIEFTPQQGTIEFTCGMNMMRGTIVAQPKGA